MPLVEEYVTLVEESINKSGKNQSKLSENVRRVGTMHQPEYLHLVNNICSYHDIRHFHMGFWKGASLFACLDGNPQVVAYANDSFFGQGVTSPLGAEFTQNSSNLGFDGRYKLFDCDFEEVPFDAFDHKINFLIYDAHHAEEAQYQGVYRCDPILDDVFILLVDDWHTFRGNPDNNDAPRKGTMRAIADRGYEICREWDVNRHVGQGIFVLRKRSSG